MAIPASLITLHKFPISDSFFKKERTFLLEKHLHLMPFNVHEGQSLVKVELL